MLKYAKTIEEQRSVLVNLGWVDFTPERIAAMPDNMVTHYYDIWYFGD